WVKFEPFSGKNNALLKVRCFSEQVVPTPERKWKTRRFWYSTINDDCLVGVTCPAFSLKP
ncbi:hypothetical protein EV363DRAFT_1182805, partial [Boletus edulis]